jgi:hypothetical protein
LELSSEQAAKFSVLSNTLIVDEGPESLFIPFPKLFRQSPRLIVVQQSSHPTWKDLENCMTLDSVAFYIFPLGKGEKIHSKQKKFDEETLRKIVSKIQIETTKIAYEEAPGLYITWPEDNNYFPAVCKTQASARATSLAHQVGYFGMFLSLHPPLLMSQRPPLLTSNIHPF